MISFYFIECRSTINKIIEVIILRDLRDVFLKFLSVIVRISNGCIKTGPFVELL